MSLITIKADFKELEKVATWVDTLEVVKSSPEIWARPIRILGMHMLETFSTEGSHLTGRGWQGLTQMTQQVRVARGHDPEHPILVQEGDLRRVTAGTLATWRPGAQAYHPKGNKIAMAASVSGNSFEATIAGPKVSNNFGGDQLSDEGRYFASMSGLRRPGFLPARPFFYIHPDAASQMTTAFAESIMSEWQSKGARLGVRRAYGRMSEIPMGRNTRLHEITTSW